MDSARSRSIIESLRTGVPCEAAVETLGSSQELLLKRFQKLLGAVSTNSSFEATGMLFSGNFGSGKSHTLAGLANEAVQAGYVVSQAVISKNLPLAREMDLLFRLLQDTRALGLKHDAFGQMMSRAQQDGQLLNMREWTRSMVQEGHLASVYDASLRAFTNLRPGLDSFETIINYWAGSSSISAPNLRSAVAGGHQGAFRVAAAAERCVHTVRFLSRMFQELGYRGWIVMFDELELMRTLGKITRAKSYAWLGFWLGISSTGRVPGLGCVGTFTPGYFLQTIDKSNPWGNQDELWRPQDLRRTPSNSRFIEDCVTTMRFIGENSEILLHRSSKERLEQIQRAVISEYIVAYGTRVEPISFVFYEAKSVRAYLREWITRWDIERQGLVAEVDQYEVAPDDSSDESEME